MTYDEFDRYNDRFYAVFQACLAGGTPREISKAWESDDSDRLHEFVWKQMRAADPSLPAYSLVRDPNPSRDLYRIGSKQRGNRLVEWRRRITDDSAWCRLVGEFWSDIDGDRGTLVAELRKVHADHRRMMMSPEEQEALANLPKTFSVWRGCYEGFNTEGVSFSLHKNIARGFPFLNRYQVRGAVPVVLRARVSRDQVVYKSDRKEEEVIAFEFLSGPSVVQYLEMPPVPKVPV